MDFTEIYELCRTSINASLDWFISIIEATDTFGFYFAIFTLILAMSFFIFPLLRPQLRGSDRARKVDDNE